MARTLLRNLLGEELWYEVKAQRFQSEAVSDFGIPTDQLDSVRCIGVVLLRSVDSMATDYAISLGLGNSGKLRR